MGGTMDGTAEGGQSFVRRLGMQMQGVSGVEDGAGMRASAPGKQHGATRGSPAREHRYRRSRKYGDTFSRVWR